MHLPYMTGGAGEIHRSERSSLRPMRVLDLHTGETVQAANDEELFQAVRGKVPEESMSDEEIRSLIEAKAYDATDS
jgi:hypothetical protein